MSDPRERNRSVFKAALEGCVAHYAALLPDALAEHIRFWFAREQERGSTVSRKAPVKSLSQCIAALQTVVEDSGENAFVLFVNGPKSVVGAICDAHATIRVATAMIETTVS